jgi:hypothetical protein
VAARKPTSNPTGKKNSVNTATSSNGKTRSDFALPSRRMFPLNTPGRVAAAPGLAERARKAGTITSSEEATVKRKAAAKRK